MYENMISIEDFNSILAFNPDYTDLYTINVGLLPPNSFTETYYDFNIISMVENSDGTFTYKLEVYNKMWDGGITFDRVPDNNSPPAVNTILTKNYNNEYYMLYITAPYTDFDIILTLNNLNNNPREVLSTSFNLDLGGSNELTYYYYESKSITFTSTDSNGEALSNVSVNLLGDTISLNNKTGLDGKCTINIPSLPPGVYNLKLTGTHVGLKNLTSYVKLTVLKEKPVINFESTGSYKGGYSSANIYLTLQGKPRLTMNLRVNCNDNQNGSNYSTEMSYNNSKYHTDYTMNFRGVHDEDTVVTCELLETEYTEETTLVINEPLNTKNISDWLELKTECESLTGVDYILIPQAEIIASTTINITRDITLIGQVGDNWPRFINSTYPYLFKIFNNNMIPVHFNVQGISFESNMNGVIYADNYSHLNFYYCRFQNNIKTDNIGTCIGNRVDSASGVGDLTSLTINDCYFLNNKGSNIASCGKTIINNCHFYLNDWKYAQHPQPYGVEVFSKECTITGSEFYLDMGLTESPLSVYQTSNFSWGKVPFYIQREAILNGVYGKEMLKDNTLQFNNNNSYIYARYLYNGNKVVASPKRGSDRKCAGHVISKRNWAWKDNVRVENRTVYDNHRNPPIINVPSSNVEMIIDA